MHSQLVVVKDTIKLKHFDPGYTGGLEKEEAKAKTEKLCHRLGELQQLLYANSTHAVVLLFQGMDASGKDGTVTAVLQHVNPIGVEVANFKLPSSEEKAHHYLWRVSKALPRYGNLGVFNRSHYEAVLVERVLGIAPHKEWSRRYEQIVAWERMLAENRIILLKFFLHLSREEQGDRLQERLENPKKRWKFSTGDLETRERWDEYAEAYEDMLSATSHPSARWHIIPADHNWYRNLLVSQISVKAVEALKLKWPEPKEDLSKIKIT